jgi:hypothetical protein
MLSEGTIIKSYMLTRLLSKTPLACLFQSINVDTGERFLTKVARALWLDTPGTIQSLGFDFRPGQSLPWKPTPSDIIETECEFLDQVKEMQLALPKPVEWGQVDDVAYVSYEFFDGVSLDEVFESGTGFTIQILIDLLQEVDRLAVHGISHGNLQPSTILVGQGSVLLTDVTHPITVRSSRQHKRLLRCITVPEFYPFLDPSHDQLAMGILLYTLVTGKHPLALEEIARKAGAARRIGSQFSQLVDDARERGANRFLSPLLSFLNPTQVKRGASEDFQELVLRTLGFSRSELSDDGGQVEVLPDTWLDNMLEGNNRPRENFWTLSDTADALNQIFSDKEPAAEKNEEPAAKPKRKSAGKAKTGKPKPQKEDDERVVLTDRGSRKVDEPDVISFEPEADVSSEPTSTARKDNEEKLTQESSQVQDDLPALYIPANGEEELDEVSRGDDDTEAVDTDANRADLVDLQDDESADTDIQTPRAEVPVRVPDDDNSEDDDDESLDEDSQPLPMKINDLPTRTEKNANISPSLPSLSFEDSESAELEVPSILPGPLRDDDDNDDDDDDDDQEEENGDQEPAGHDNDGDRIIAGTDEDEEGKADQELDEGEKRSIGDREKTTDSAHDKDLTVVSELLAELVSMAESEPSKEDEPNEHNE